MNKLLDKVGFWSSVSVVIFTIIFTIAFIPYMATLKWVDIASFAASFRTLPYLAWVIPCLLLALAYPVLTSAIYLIAPTQKKIWGLLGLVFGTIYSAVLTTNYWLLMTVVRSALENNFTEGLGWYVVGSPYSITNTLEGIGYGFMGLSTIFAGLVFSGSKGDNWIRRSLVFNGLSGLLGVVFGAFGVVAMTLVSLALWCLSFPVAIALVAVFFYKRGKKI